MSEHDYAALDDDALNRAIAERVGWRVVAGTDYGDEYGPCFNIVDPNGRIVAWDRSETGVKNFWYGNEVPRYSTDLNAAWTLLADSGQAVGVEEYIGPDGISRAQAYVDDLARVYRAFSPLRKPSRACCYAWLAYDDAERERAAREAKSG